MRLLTAEMELRIALRRRRLLALNVLVPLALVTPIALGAAPAFHAAAVYAVLFTLFGIFGSAIPLVRDAESGLMRRVLLGGVRPAGYLVQRAGANAAVDLAELTPALLVAALGAAASGPAVLVACAALAGSLWVANLLGVLVAAAARSVAETALFAATAGLLLLHASGVFRTPADGSVGALLEAGAPFRALHEALLGLTTGSGVEGGVAAGVWALLLPVALALAGGALTGVLSRAGRG